MAKAKRKGKEVMNFWSRKYGVQEQVSLEPAEIDVFVATTQTRQPSRSAHAFEIYSRDLDQVVLAAKINASEQESSQERGALSAIVRALQAWAPRSNLRIICRLENVVEAIEGKRYLPTNADILEEIIALRRSKSLTLSAIRPNCKRHEAILTRLLNLARRSIA
jgi:hypothetical protein